VRWYAQIVSALRRLGWEDNKFKTNLDYIVRETLAQLKKKEVFIPLLSFDVTSVTPCVRPQGNTEMSSEPSKDLRQRVASLLPRNSFIVRSHSCASTA
jgi:hypothetical protein